MTLCDAYLGRTDWDRAVLESVRPDARYYQSRGDPQASLSTSSAGTIPGPTPRSSARPAHRCSRVWRRSSTPSPCSAARRAGRCVCGLPGRSRAVPLWPVIKRRLDDPRLEGRVELLGVLDRPAIVRELRRPACTCSPSHIDNSPNALCEAMLVGVPCAASFVGGIPSLVRHGGDRVAVPRPRAGDARASYRAPARRQAAGRSTGCRSSPRSAREARPRARGSCGGAGLQGGDQPWGCFSCLKAVVRVLVTGGAGFIGSNIVAAAARAGARAGGARRPVQRLRREPRARGAVRRGRRARRRGGARRRRGLRRDRPPGRQRRQRALHRRSHQGLADQRPRHPERAPGRPPARPAAHRLLVVGRHLRRAQDAAHRRRPPPGPRLALRRQQAGRREDVPGLQQALRHGQRVPALLQRLRRQPALRRLRQRHPDLRRPHPARRAHDDLRRRRADARLRERPRRGRRQHRRGHRRRRRAGRLQHRQRHARHDQRPGGDDAARGRPRGRRRVRAAAPGRRARQPRRHGGGAGGLRLRPERRARRGARRVPGLDRATIPSPSGVSRRRGHEGARPGRRGHAGPQGLRGPEPALRHASPRSSSPTARGASFRSTPACPSRGCSAASTPCASRPSRPPSSRRAPTPW